MYFKRKAYNELLEWKNHYADEYAALLEGARRVGINHCGEFCKKRIQIIYFD